MSVFSLNTYVIDSIDLTTPASKKLMETKLVDFIYDLVRKLTNERTNILNVVIAWLLTTISSLEQLKLNSNDMKTVEKLERFKRVYKIMEDIEIRLK